MSEQSTGFPLDTEPGPPAAPVPAVVPKQPVAAPDPVETRVQLLGAKLDGAGLDISRAEAIEPAAIAPFWASGDLFYLCGLKTSGKTTLALDLAVAPLLPEREGSAWGGVLQVNMARFGPDGRVAIIDGEDSRQRWASRVKALLAGGSVDMGRAGDILRSRLLYYKPSELGLRDKTHWERNSRAAVRFLARQGVRLVVADTASRLWQPTDPNQPDWVFDGLAPFHDELRDARICCLLNAHHKRPGEFGAQAHGPLGTSQQENETDGLLFVNRAADKGELEIRHEKSRRSWWIQPGDRIRLKIPRHRFGYEPLPPWREIWPHDGPSGDSAGGSGTHFDPSAALSPMKREILTVLQQAHPGSRSESELVSSTEHDRSSVFKACRELEAAGLIEAVPDRDPREWMLRRSSQ
jgi:hypothetical protein